MTAVTSYYVVHLYLFKDCVFAAQDNWAWIIKLVQCVDVHLKKGAAYHQVSE